VRYALFFHKRTTFFSKALLLKVWYKFLVFYKASWHYYILLICVWLFSIIYWYYYCFLCSYLYWLRLYFSNFYWPFNFSFIVCDYIDSWYKLSLSVFFSFINSVKVWSFHFFIIRVFIILIQFLMSIDRFIHFMLSYYLHFAILIYTNLDILLNLSFNLKQS